MKPQEKLSQYRTDVARDNGEIQSRGQDLLNPDSKENSEEWNAAHVAAHERRFPFSDNLTTLMFIVGSDLSEAQRERLTSSSFSRELMSLLTHLSQQRPYLWNCSVRRKVQ